ncbi:hypothetical protein I316_04139 [Kwoniella heveanensis BCC8398]|uniref:Uncharacterized protein n=1 Tax=Kwoniella heveanensis BCC8398 TaxID=1296120 RepID=A0A1B9GSZ1_9TREE|nr:hypothetical protein I316_04139 [Kwoniella heveanensis BCC8398]
MPMPMPMLLPSSFPKSASSIPRSRRDLYRSYLQHLRLLPDPHVWSVLIPRFQKLLFRHGHVTLDRDDRHHVAHTNNRRVDNVIQDGAPHAESSKAAEARASATANARARTRGEILVWRHQKALKQAGKELRRLRAAVACHPHALARLLEETYGQRGVLRWDKLRSISSLYDNRIPTKGDVLPPPLQPLRPPPKAPKESQPRARKHVPASAIRKEAERAIERDWTMIRPPVSLPAQMEMRNDEEVNREGKDSINFIGASEGGPESESGSRRMHEKGVIYNLRLLAGLELPRALNTALDSNTDSEAHFDTRIRSHPTPLPYPPEAHIAQRPPTLRAIRQSLDLSPLSSLSPSISLIFPRGRPSSPPPTLREPPLLPPKPKAVRQNPTTWSLPRRLDDRLLRRCYKRLWDSLDWVRPVTPLPSPPDSSNVAAATSARSDRSIERWKKCSYEEMRAYEQGQLDHSGTDDYDDARKEKEQGKGKNRGKLSKKRKAKDAAASEVTLDGVKDDGTWSIVSEDERRWISQV